jgi:hypothetical protein
VVTPSPAVQRAAAQRLASVRYVLACGTRTACADWTRVRALAPADAELEARILAACIDEELRGVLETPVALACRACERVHEITDTCPLKQGETRPQAPSEKK